MEEKDAHVADVLIDISRTLIFQEWVIEASRNALPDVLFRDGFCREDEACCWCIDRRQTQ